MKVSNSLFLTKAYLPAASSQRDQYIQFGTSTKDDFTHAFRYENIMEQFVSGFEQDSDQEYKLGFLRFRKNPDQPQKIYMIEEGGTVNQFYYYDADKKQFYKESLDKPEEKEIKEPLFFLMKYLSFFRRQSQMPERISVNLAELNYVEIQDIAEMNNLFELAIEDSSDGQLRPVQR